MNCCFLILILLLCNGNTGCQNTSCGKKKEWENDEKRHHHHDMGCPCMNPEPRPYAPYPEPRTCGCEE